MSGDIGAMPGPWLPGAQEFKESATYAGQGEEDPAGALPKTTQRIEVTLEAWAYRLGRREDLNMDWYAVNGIMRHGVVHTEMKGAYAPADHWLSVGYYATDMRLVATLENPEAGSIWDQGPTSTVGSKSTSWNIGGNLTGMVGDISGLTAGVSAGFGQTYSSPAVNTSQATIGKEVRWDIALPGVGFAGANPYPPSYAGYEWYFGIIFQVPRDAKPAIRLEGKTNYRYDLHVALKTNG